MSMRRILTLAAAAAATMTLTAALPAFDAVLGRAIFERVWVGAGSSTRAADGLGPLHNARSCAGCHPRGGPAAAVGKDGGLGGAGVVARLGGPAGGDPVYGLQIQTRSLAGGPAEARLAIAAPAGAAPEAVLSDLCCGPLAADTTVTLRRAPSLAGRAAFERVDRDAVAALADPQDRDGDGISGRVRMVPGDGGAPVPGIYGWRAEGPTLHHQIASAFSVDLGLSTDARPDPAGDCTAAESACRAVAASGYAREGPDVEEEMMPLLAAYIASLAPPPADLARPGGRLFVAAGCATCHVPALPTRDGGLVPVFSDLLLHDMGPGLAGSAEAGIAATEWRTAPLLGFATMRPDQRRYLHDGRAESVAAAVAWHDGEAQAARQRFAALGDDERQALVEFVEGRR